MEKLEKLGGNAIKPCGWLLRQLKLQLGGLSGHMHEVFPDVGDDSAWLGGNGEAWERGPYYLDGIIPLAFLTDNKPLLARAQRWVDCILASENEYVGFGPKRSVDWWPRFVALKALRNWQLFTDDERVLPFMMRYFAYMDKNLQKFPPKYWAYFRAFECFEALDWAYDQTADPMLLSLSHKLEKMSFDWAHYFMHFRFTKPMTAYYSRRVFNWGKNIGEKWDEKGKTSLKIPRKQPATSINTFNRNPTVQLIQQTHAVNVAMAYKYPVLKGVICGESRYCNTAKLGYSSIMRAHGLAIGLPSGDEHFMGPNPAQGVELCSVVEFMYSMEELLRCTGDVFYAELLEFVCFNALPATFTADMCAHQYVQQVNQIAADRNKNRGFYALHEDANTFGVAPNFGCCAANMHQGFPKFAQCLAMRRGAGLVFPVYSPCEVDSIVCGKRYRVKESTLYPFGDVVNFTVLDDIPEGSLSFRILPETKEILVNGEPVETGGENPYFELKRNFSAGDTVQIVTEPEILFKRNADGSVSVQRGALLYALSLVAEEKSFGGIEPFQSREFTTRQKWNYGVTVKNPDVSEQHRTHRATGAIFTSRGIPDMPFDKSNPSSVITVDAAEIENWKEKNGSTDKYPEKLLVGKHETIALVPYGSTVLRITQFPKVQEDE